MKNTINTKMDLLVQIVAKYIKIINIKHTKRIYYSIFKKKIDQNSKHFRTPKKSNFFSGVLSVFEDFHAGVAAFLAFEPHSGDARTNARGANNRATHADQTTNVMSFDVLSTIQRLKKKRVF
jgi:hypothetical protein